MPIRCELIKDSLVSKKILVLGSGALSIGQAGEFDYSGSQAIQSLKEEGFQIVLVNPNIATVQTDKSENKTVYLYPVTKKWVEKVIEKEKPLAIAACFGGQTAIKCVMDLDAAGVLKKHNVLLLGPSIETLKLTEDRELFAKSMISIDAPVLDSHASSSVDEACIRAKEIGYPVIIRAAYALGGLGSGFADTESELREKAAFALSHSPQILVEKSIKGWKEVEYEVMRDEDGNTICVCNMENFDPLGVHTGDSIVVAPSQTLNDGEYQLLRDYAIKIANHLNIVGECNVQYALDPYSQKFFVIEVNARLSRSSALASKATGYPIAYIAAKVILGYRLLELKNPVNGTTSAFFEPALDYLTVKVPKWDLRKFDGVSHELGSQMKSVGEVLGIGRNFYEAIQKSFRMVYDDELGLIKPLFKDLDKVSVMRELERPTDLRMFAIYEAFMRNYTLSEVYEYSRINKWFLSQILEICKTQKKISESFKNSILDVDSFFKSVPSGEFSIWKARGFSDRQLAFILQPELKGLLLESAGLEVRSERIKKGILPRFKKIDTTSGEFATKSNYLYSTYVGSESDVGKLSSSSKSLIILGGGSYRIGSSVEFDWCAVRASKYSRENGYSSIVINCNPETVSTDFNASDRLYFEEVSLERVLDIYEYENPKGLIGCLGGQVSNSLVTPLEKMGVKIIGHSSKSVELAEDRSAFSTLLDDLEVDQPRWEAVTDQGGLSEFIDEVGFPILVRPSFVLSGTAMKVAYNDSDLKLYLEKANEVSTDYPVVLTAFIQDAKEIEVDGVAKDGEIARAYISEHVENAGVHSGDATVIFPAQKIYTHTMREIKKISQKIVSALNLNGPFNIQLLAKHNDVQVIECNARASRSFPFISKVSGFNLIDFGTELMLGGEIVSEDVFDKVEIDRIGVKAAMFSFSRLDGADPLLGVEMASTGEVGCIGQDVDEAMLLALEGTSFEMPKKGILLSTGREKEKVKFLEENRVLFELDLPVYATPGSADYMEAHGYSVEKVSWSEPGSSLGVIDLIKEGKVDLVINLPKNFEAKEISYNERIRRYAIIKGCHLLTDLNKGIAYCNAIKNYEEISSREVIPL